MDDLYMLKPKNSPQAVREFFQELSGEHFYGDSLRLERAKKVDPFGFIAMLTAEGLALRPKLTFRLGLDESHFQRKLPILQGPRSFQAEKQLKGVVFGQGLRILDTTASNDSSLVTSSLERYLLELSWVGYPTPWVNEVSEKLGKACNRPIAIPMFTKENALTRSDLLRVRAASDLCAELEVLSQTFHDRLVPF